jgi:nucleoside-diphosphate-sugar epimerase
MRRYLIIGGGGFIGSHLVRVLVGRGEPVTVLDAFRQYADVARDDVSRWRAETLLAGAEVLSLDVADAPALREVVTRVQADSVVHLANLPLASVAQRHPRRAREEIVHATAAVLSALQDTPRTRLVYVSSSMVYGNFTRHPMPEDGPCRPLERYGAMKLEAERLVRARPGSTIVRPSAVYGPGDGNDRFIERLVAAARLGTPLTVSGGGAACLDFTWVGDLAEGLALAASHAAAAGETFNMTRGEGRTLADAVAIVRSLGHRLRVRRTDEAPVIRPQRGALDISRARRLLGYDPRHSLEDGLERYLGRVPLAAVAAV